MTKQDFIGIIYVSIAVIIWGTIGSIIDYPLLNKNVYLAGSLGQITTFSLTGIFTTLIAIFIYKKVLTKYFGQNSNSNT